MGPTIGRAVAGVFTLGLSEVVGGLLQKPTSAPEAPAKPAQVNEEKAFEDERSKERRRRQLVARQNRSIRTSPLGASIQENLLGGTTLTGQ